MPQNPRTNLADYYGSIRLNPVGHDISREEQLKNHEKKRRSLLEYHLKLPFPMWKGARVLEYGPGSGENAVVLARRGAKLTFVEPLDYLIEELKKKFAALGLSDRIEAVHHDVVERFETAETFDVVFGEGFVHFLDDGVFGVKKMAERLNPGGLLVISIIHPPGTFIEFVKKVYLELACAALGKKTDVERFALAQALFLGQFERINHSRGFESWSKDCVLNPLYRPAHFLDLPECLAGLPDCTLYSSWPNYLDADDLVWHKNVKDAKRLRQEALDGYYARAPHFLHSVPQPPRSLPLYDPKDGKKILSALTACYKKLDALIEKKSADAKAAVAALKGLRAALAPHKQSKLPLLAVDEAIALFSDGAKAKTEKDWVRAWTKRGFFQKAWGSPGHYFVFQKRPD